MKYIIVGTEAGNEYAVLFDEVLIHSKVAGGRPVTSAGFCHLEVRMGMAVGDDCEIVPVTYGKSVSLGKASRPSDAAIIAGAIRRRI